MIMHESVEQAGLYFKPLQQTAFQKLQHAASLKGLLKPFKGKSTVEEWANQCQSLRDELIQLGKQSVLPQLKTYPLALLEINLAQQTTGAGTAFLRWCSPNRSKMGVHLWSELVQSNKTPVHLIDDLYVLEMQRIVLNMQISLTHTLYRQALECIAKMEHAEEIYQKRQK